MHERLYLGVDVGTGSARAAIFDRRGMRRGLGTHPVQRWQPLSDFHEQSSEDIWRACGRAIRAALMEADVPASTVVGIGFDATCSLVTLDAQDRAITVSPSGAAEQNVILWMDHRAIEQSARINTTRHDALRSVGGNISPEMQLPKLLWLKEHLPKTWATAARFMDLADFLSYRATGCDVRSRCTTTCKWNYRSERACWDDGFLRCVGLADLAEANHARIGRDIRMQGEEAGKLTAAAAFELGLEEEISVAVSLIDAHAGALGVLGMPLEGFGIEASLEGRMALICGSSTCHMTLAAKELFTPGVWGPYFSALLPDSWLAEGGQSATGILIDQLIDGHPQGKMLRERAEIEGVTAYEILNRRVSELARTVEFPAALTRDFHVYPDFHGNRSPLADSTLRGMICGLSLDESLDALTVQYLATLQAIALGTRHILEQLNSQCYAIKTLIACGGGAKNELYLCEHADATGCSIVLPEEPEAVLLGAAMLGAVACRDQPSLEAAMRTMNRPGRLITPSAGAIARYHEAKYQVHGLMRQHQRAYAQVMHSRT